MEWGQGRGALRVPAFIASVLACVALAGCNTVQQASPTAGTPRGASIAFDSIDGPPPEVFQRLVRDLDAEAKTRQLAVLSRDDAAAYRVRGYLGAHTKGNEATVTWLWDVYDGEQQRVLRVSGEEKLKGKNRDVWSGLDEAALKRIARSSIEQLSAFLSSGAAPAGVQPAPQDKEGSPEAAGIVRISTPQADPLPNDRATAQSPRPTTVAQHFAD